MYKERWLCLSFRRLSLSLFLLPIFSKPPRILLPEAHRSVHDASNQTSPNSFPTPQNLPQPPPQIDSLRVQFDLNSRFKPNGKSTDQRPSRTVRSKFGILNRMVNRLISGHRRIASQFYCADGCYGWVSGLTSRPRP